MNELCKLGIGAMYGPNDIMFRDVLAVGVKEILIMVHVRTDTPVRFHPVLIVKKHSGMDTRSENWFCFLSWSRSRVPNSLYSLYAYTRFSLLGKMRRNTPQISISILFTALQRQQMI